MNKKQASISIISVTIRRLGLGRKFYLLEFFMANNPLKQFFVLLDRKMGKIGTPITSDLRLREMIKNQILNDEL